MKLKSIRAMQKLETAPYSKTKKNLRSALPIRKQRPHISPILYSSSLNLNARTETSAFSVNSNSCSYFGAGEVSCESSRVSIGSESETRSRLRKRHFDETGGYEVEENGNAPYRRVTRSYYGGKAAEKKEVSGDAVDPEASESSCVESNSGADFGARKLKLKSKELISESDKDDVTSLISGVELCSEAAKLAEKTVKYGQNRAPDFEFPVGNFTGTNSECTVEQKPETETETLQLQVVDSSDLACNEQLSSYNDVSDYSSSQTLSDIYNTDFGLSDYTPSIFFDSGSEFSERSDEDSPPSPTFAFLLQYRQGLLRSSTALHFEAASRVNEVHKDHSTFLKFEDEENEESYQLLRSRERMQVFLRDYTEDYSSTAEGGDLILQQRWQMVRWIVERCTATELQPETKFLGVSLLDRFLSKGFFKSERMLQIVGIACLTLASRIEENQPYNCVRKRDFYVGSNVYSRYEVVAMEWLVQEVLNFQCFLPTIYNFLWFYLRAARADAQVEKRAKYLAVLQMSDHVQLRYWPSTVAAALVILASLEGNHEASSQRVIETHVRTEGDDLHECIESLEWLLNYV